MVVAGVVGVLACWAVAVTGLAEAPGAGWVVVVVVLVAGVWELVVVVLVVVVLVVLWWEEGQWGAVVQPCWAVAAPS